MTLSVGNHRRQRGEGPSASREAAAIGWTPLAAMLALALAIRLAGLNHESFSMDEVTEIGIARLPVQAILLTADGFPPLYHLILKGWLALWGSELAARWLSALLGLVTVYAVYRLALASAGQQAALAAAILTTVSPMHVWFAQESRAYALALPLAALAHWRFLEAYTSNTWRDWLIYAAIALASVCTHYFLAIVLALQALWLIPRLVQATRDRRPALAVYALLAASAVPVLLLLRPDLTHQSGTGDGRIGLEALPYSLYVFLLGFSAGPSVRELHDMRLREAAAGFFPWTLALAACLLPMGFRWLKRERPLREAVAYLLLTGLAPLAVTVLASTTFELKYKVSYVSWASIPLLVLLGDAIVKSWDRRWAPAAVGGYLTLAVVALGSRHLVDRHRTEDLRSLATHLEAQASPGIPVYVVPGYMAEPLSSYMGAEWDVRAVPKGDEAVNSVTKITSDAMSGGVWLVYSRAFDGDPTGAIRRHLDSLGTTRLAAKFAGILLYEVEPGGEDRPRP